jgi:hypothetical protein
MTCFDIEMSRRVAAYLASRDAYIEEPTVIAFETTVLAYPEVFAITGPDGFDRPAEAWHRVWELLSAHRVLMGKIMAQVISRRFAGVEDDGA